MKKTKKWLTLVMCMAMLAASMGGCGESGTAATQAPASAAGTEAKPDNQEKETEKKTEDKKSMKAALVTAQKLGDQGVTDLCHSGFMKAVFRYQSEPT